MTKVELGQYYEKYRSTLLSSAMWHLNDKAWAEDILHDSFEYMLLNRGLYDPDRGKPLTWMAIVVNRRCLNALRDRATEAKRQLESVTAPNFAPSPEDEAIRAENEALDTRLAERLEEYLDLDTPDPEVPDEVRGAIIAHYVTGREWEDIAQEMDVSRFVVYRKVQKALETYRRRLFSDEKFK